MVKSEEIEKVETKESVPEAPKGHVIEVAKSGRARCRTCSEGISKGELRLGEETPNLFSESGGMSYRWHHLRCAAQKKPRELKSAMARYAGEIPERAEFERAIGEWEANQHAKKKATAFPFADRAPSARSKCVHCHAVIEKGEFRVAVERPADSYMGASSAAYLHPRCAVEHSKSDPESLATALASNTVALGESELADVVAIVREGAANRAT